MHSALLGTVCLKIFSSLLTRSLWQSLSIEPHKIAALFGRCLTIWKEKSMTVIDLLPHTFKYAPADHNIVFMLVVICMLYYNFVFITA